MTTEVLRESNQDFIKVITRAHIESRKDILRAAQGGDWKDLAAYLREGGRVTPPIRAFLADILDTNKTSPSTREREAVEIAEFILWAQQCGKKEKEYSADAEKRFKRSWRQLQKRAAKGRKFAGLRLELERHLNRSLTEVAVLHGISLKEAMALLGPSLWEISDTALTPYTCHLVRSK